MTRIAVDRERCVGSGTCEMVAADLFEVGDDGIVAVGLGPEDSDDAVVPHREHVRGEQLAGARPDAALPVDHDGAHRSPPRRAGSRLMPWTNE